MWSTACRASGFAVIAVLLMLGAMAYTHAADGRDFEESPGFAFEEATD